VSYSTDLSDQQWTLIEPLLPKALPGGRPRSVNMRRVVDAMLYIVKTGCQWRLLPSDFPPWQTVYWYFKIMRQEGQLNRISQMLVKKVRRREGKKSDPTIAIMDSQSVKSGKMVSREKGYDGGKHVKGRKRHIAVDILGLPLAIVVTSANTHDKRGGEKVVERIKRWLPKGVKKVYADGGYSGEPFRKIVKNVLGATLSIRKGIGKKFKGFKPIPKRWVVERTFAWLGDYRRLDKDQERHSWNSLAMIRWASISMMLRRLFPAPVW
jgi:putative transposase